MCVQVCAERPPVRTRTRSCAREEWDERHPSGPNPLSPLELEQTALADMTYSTNCLLLMGWQGHEKPDKKWLTGGFEQVCVRLVFLVRLMCHGRCCA